jgi:Regulator of chromosome condensation (RCC1) repeat
MNWKKIEPAFLSAVAVSVSLLGAQACWHVGPDSGSLPDGSLDGALDAPLAEGSALAEASTVDGADADAGEADVYVDAAQPFASSVISAGLGFGCEIVNGQVWCWGDNAYGQAGSTPSATPVAHPQLVPLVPIVVSDGGDAGDGGDASDARDASDAEAGTSGPVATAIALGDYHACAVTSAGDVYCWGLNTAYQLGHASATSGDLICPTAVAGQTVPCTSTPTLVTNVDPAQSIQAAGAWTCTVTTTQGIQCWGAVQPAGATDGGVACGSGALAQGGACYPAPYTVSGVSGVTQLAVAYDHACAIMPGATTADGGNQVACWGSNNEGQVSPSACPDSICTSPLARSDLTTTSGLAAGDLFTCALDATGAVRCFGDNTFGQLGHAPGTEGDLGVASADASFGIYNPTASTVGGLGIAAALVGGGNESACALIFGGSVACWGDVSASGGATPAPVTIPGLPVMSALGTYDSTTACGLAADQSIWCWSIGPGPGATQIQ